MKSFSKIFKALVLIALFLSADARLPYSFRRNAKAYQMGSTDYVNIAKEGIDSVSKVLEGFSEIATAGSKAATVLKSLGAFAGALGPALAILNIFLGDPMDKKLDEINNKLDQVISTMDFKFKQLGEQIEKTDCFRTLKDTLSIVGTHTSKLRENMKNSILQGGRTSESKRNFFLRKMRQENNVSTMRNSINSIINSLLSTGGTLDQCDIIKIFASGTNESQGLKGSSSALLRLVVKIFYELNQGLAYLYAVAESQAIEGEDIKVTLAMIGQEYQGKIQKAAERLIQISDNLDEPATFARNTKENLIRIWNEIKSNYSTGDWNGYAITQTIYNKLKSVFLEKNIAVFTYRDYKEDNYFKAVRKYDASFRTKDLTPSYDKNYVIEVAFTSFVEQKRDVAQYQSDVNCLDVAYNTIFPFRQRTDNAANFITNSLFDSISSRCSNKLGGLVFVWEPPKGSSVLHASYYQPTSSYNNIYKQCKWRDSKWCAMDGRMYHVISQPENERWRWRVYIWTTSP